MASKLNDLCDKYKAFVISSHGLVGNIESACRVLSYFTPGKGEHSAVIAELLYSASNLLVFLNDAILRQAANIKLKVPLAHKELCNLLAVLEHIEVFLEVASHGLGGDFHRWFIIVCVQIAKAALKLVLLLKYNSGLQCTPVIPSLKRGPYLQRKLKEAAEEHGEEPVSTDSLLSASLIVEQGDNPQKTFTLKTSGRSVRTLEAAPPLLQRNWRVPNAPENTQNESNVSSPTKLDRQQVFAECVHIARPLVHLLGMSIFGQNSWKPWLLACGLDISSLSLLGEKTKYNSMEQAELRRRTVLMILYLLRSPFYDSYSKARLMFLLKGMVTYLPGVRLLVRPLLDYLPWWQRVYFYVWMC